MTIWNVFENKGMPFVHLNVNSLLNKIDELRTIVKKSKASVFGITETKIDSSINDEELNIDGYNIIRSDRNRHGGGVACYIKNDISFNRKDNFSNAIENVFLDIYLPKCKTITLGIIYRPPNQNTFIQNLNEGLQNLDFAKNEIYLLGDFNIDLTFEGQYILKFFFRKLKEATAKFHLLKP